MTQFQIKEFDLRFIIDKEVKLTHGVNVSLSDVPPTRKEDFYWIDSIKYDPLGFMYQLYGMEENYHAGGLYPLLPILVSDDALDIHDLFYHNGNIYESMGLFLDDEDKWKVLNEFNEVFYETEVSKVIATPEMFGWLYNEGPPHDHNYDWVDSRFLEVYHQMMLPYFAQKGFKVTIVVDEQCLDKVSNSERCLTGVKLVPSLHDGKIIIDRYDLLRHSKSTVIY